MTFALCLLSSLNLLAKSIWGLSALGVDVGSGSFASLLSSISDVNKFSFWPKAFNMFPNLPPPNLPPPNNVSFK